MADSATGHAQLDNGNALPYDTKRTSTVFQDLTPDVHPIESSNSNTDMNGETANESSDAAGHSLDPVQEEHTSAPAAATSRPATVGEGATRDTEASNPNALSGLEPGVFHNITGTTHIPGEEDQDPELRKKHTYLPEKNDADTGLTNGDGQAQQEEHFTRPQGPLEYPGRDHANVVSHSTFGNLTGQNEPEQSEQPQQQYGTVGTDADGHDESYLSPEAREAEQQRALDAENGLATEGKSRPKGFAGLQPSRSYIQESRPSSAMPRPGDEAFGHSAGQQGNLPMVTQDFAALPQQQQGTSYREPTIGATGVSREPSYIGKTQSLQQQPHQGQFIEGDPQTPARGAGSTRGSYLATGVPLGLGAHQPEQEQLAAAPLQQQQNAQQIQQPYEQEQAVGANQQSPILGRQQNGSVRQPSIAANNRQSYIAGAAGPTTGVQPAAIPSDHDYTRAPRPISGGGLAAALATSGHEVTKKDKKALRNEIKQEKKFEKNLEEERKQESHEIALAMKTAKKSVKKAEKSAAYEQAFRRPYEKAIKKEVKWKQRLLKVTNEYNKVAADLERATKEMEIRRNNHTADLQTRDADQQKVEELRHRKGQNDMDREARHGESLTKQTQAKRALSMSSKRRSILG